MSKKQNKPEPKLPWKYEIEINCLLRRVYKSFSIEGKAMECERDLMKKLVEVYEIFTSTKDKEYRKVYSKSLKRYKQMIYNSFPKFKNLTNLENIELYPEEEDMEKLIWEKSIGIPD
jgi:hypothetical protein